MISRIYLTALFTCAVSLETGNKANFSTNQEACKKFGVEPYFDPELIVGPAWRVYYSWNISIENECLDITFKHANAWIVNRFFTDMGEYLVEQPAWVAAVLYMTSGPANQQMLLFADRGPAGRVYGVPNIRREPNFVTKKKSVPLLQFQIKLLRGGKYLVMMDCLSGITTLSAHLSEDPPDRADIESTARNLTIGDGLLACKTNSTSDKGGIILKI